MRRSRVLLAGLVLASIAAVIAVGPTACRRAHVRWLLGRVDAPDAWPARRRLLALEGCDASVRARIAVAAVRDARRAWPSCVVASVLAPSPDVGGVTIAVDEVVSGAAVGSSVAIERDSRRAPWLMSSDTAAVLHALSAARRPVGPRLAVLVPFGDGPFDYGWGRLSVPLDPAGELLALARERFGEPASRGPERLAR